MQDMPNQADAGLAWLTDDGPHSDIVLSTRIRLARNLEGRPFGPRGQPSHRAEVLRLTREAAEAAPALRDAATLVLPTLAPAVREMLGERHLVSRELLGAVGASPESDTALILAPQQPLSVMVNEEDHLRLQGLVAGFRLHYAWSMLEQLDDELGRLLPYAFNPEFGYLTSCPTNVGTGMRASVLMHLPGLVLTQEIGKVLQGLTQVGLTYRGLAGEGSDVVGNFFQVSNQTTLGKSEEELIDHLQRIVQKVIHYEAEARAVLLRDAPMVIEDKVWRAYGLLRHARAASFEEVMNLLSGIRLGVGLKLIPEVRVYTLNRIMIFSQSAHLHLAAGKVLTETETDVARASFVREALASDATRSDGPPASPDSQ